jgi:hypothetical protein
MVYFEYLSAPNIWTQVGTTQNYDIDDGSGLKCRMGANSVGGSSGTVNYTIDNVFITNDSYSTSEPI